MKFRRNLFIFLFLVTLAWSCAALASINQVVTTTAAGTPVPGVENVQAYRAGQTIGNGIFSGLGIGFLTCTGFLPGMVFLFLGWRNHVGWVNKTRHEEQLEAIRSLK